MSQLKHERDEINQKKLNDAHHNDEIQTNQNKRKQNNQNVRDLKSVCANSGRELPVYTHIVHKIIQ